MKVSLKTRKPVDQLVAGDLSAFPVWEYALDEEDVEGRDETWVRPVKTKVVPLGQYSLLVAADLKVASGRTFGGFVVVTTAEGSVEIIGGVILRESDYLPIPSPKQFGFEESKGMLLSRLRLSEPDVFPIAYTLRVPIEGEQVLRSGVLA